MRFSIGTLFAFVFLPLFSSSSVAHTQEDGKPISHFTVAGKDRVFHAADANIDGQSILVESPNVAQPVAVRFAWGNADEPNLMNEEGLPCSSFRTDDWEIKPRKPLPRKRANSKPVSKQTGG